MKNLKIRELDKEDIESVVNIWYEASDIAHNFIPERYWKDNKDLMVSKYIPMSETYLACEGNNILGFIAVIDDYLAALFVKPELQGKGIGSLLLNHIKTLREKLQLKVYVKNKNSVEFYKAKGFSVLSESTDENTGEKEFVMEWNK